MFFADREHAGKQLAHTLRHYNEKDTVVLALPRGGVVIGAEVAKKLSVPLGLVLVRKIGHPLNPEYAIGAIAEDDKPILNKSEMINVNDEWLKRAVSAGRKLIEHRRELYYDDDFTPPDLRGKTVILVDDGIATGYTMEAAVQAVKRKRPKRIIVAVPVAPEDSIEMLEEAADEVIVLDEPSEFLGAIGNHYMEFEQVDDEEVRTLLREAYNHVYERTA